MSRMIPPFIGEGTISEAEKRFFHSLQKLPDDYVVLHSLGLASHKRKVFGEIDFLIICSEGLLSLEVKGGEVFRKDGVWHFVNRHGQESIKAEGPFKQVAGAMFSLRDYMKSRFPGGHPLVDCIYASGVVFPDIVFTQKDPEIIREIVFDAGRSEEEIPDYIREVFKYWREQLREKHGIEGRKLGPNDIHRAAEYLRGDFGFAPSLSLIVQNTEKSLLALTEEQADRLGMIEENPRILLKGGAGTGKTLLSMEHAKKAAMRGKKVLFLCFNRMLANYLRHLLAAQNPDLAEAIDIQHFHGFLGRELEAGGIELGGNDGHYSSSQYYSWVLPQAFLDMVQTRGFQSKYDCLVVDEGQDLLTEPYIMCLDEVVAGGLKDGNWQINIDPNQNIYNKEFESGLRVIMGYQPVSIKLDTNCRNTRPIGVHSTLYTGMEPARFFRVDGESISSESYQDAEDERRKLVRTVRQLLSKGINPGDVILLSHHTYENSCLGGRNIFQGICDFQNITGLDSGNLPDHSLKFCTVHSFKGLESPVVILLDVDDFLSGHMRFLNYIAMSRAKSLLHVFYPAAKAEELDQMVQSSSALLALIKD